MADNAQGRLNDELRGLKDDISKLGHDISALLNTFTELGGEQVDGARSAVNEEIAKRQEELRRSLQELKARGERTADSLEAELNRRPMQSLLLAFGAGFLVAKLLRKR